MPFLSRTIQNPPPIDTITSTDGVVTVSVYGTGVLLKADLSKFADPAIQQAVLAAGDPTVYRTTPNPILQARFTRDGDQLVRSGNDAWAPAGVAFAFDMEAALGGSASWSVQPVYADGTVGPASDAVPIMLPEPVKDSWCWIKSINQPDLSMLVELHIPDPETDESARDTLTPIAGSAFPGGGWDVPVEPAQTLTVETYTGDEYQGLRALLHAGPVLVQTPSLIGLPDFYALRQTVHTAYLVGAYDPRRVVTITLQPIARPATLDAPLIIPGRSYDQLAAYAGSYDQLDSMYPTYDDMITPRYDGATATIPFQLPATIG